MRRGAAKGVSSTMERAQELAAWAAEAHWCRCYLRATDSLPAQRNCIASASLSRRSGGPRASGDCKQRGSKRQGLKLYPILLGGRPTTEAQLHRMQIPYLVPKAELGFVEGHRQRLHSHELVSI